MTDAKHNSAPPHEEHAATIRELEIEAKPFLTGAAISTQAQADAIGVLVGKARAAEKAADAARVEEKRPHDEAAAAVQAAYKPALDTAKRIQKAAKDLLAGWIAKVDAERRAREAELAAEAARLAEEARQAREAAAGDLEAMAEAEELLESAKTHGIAARHLAKTSSGVQAGGRKVSLRTVVDIAVDDESEAARWAWKMHRPELMAEVERLALAAVRRHETVPGVRRIERKEAA